MSPFRRNCAAPLLARHTGGKPEVLHKLLRKVAQTNKQRKKERKKQTNNEIQTSRLSSSDRLQQVRHRLCLSASHLNTSPSSPTPWHICFDCIGNSWFAKSTVRGGEILRTATKQIEVGCLTVLTGELYYCSLVLVIHHICHFFSTWHIFGYNFSPHKKRKTKQNRFHGKTA